MDAAGRGRVAGVAADAFAALGRRDGAVQSRPLGAGVAVRRSRRGPARPGAADPGDAAGHRTPGDHAGGAHAHRPDPSGGDGGPGSGARHRSGVRPAGPSDAPAGDAAACRPAGRGCAQLAVLQPRALRRSGLGRAGDRVVGRGAGDGGQRAGVSVRQRHPATAAARPCDAARPCTDRQRLARGCRRCGVCAAPSRHRAAVPVRRLDWRSAAADP